MIIYCFEGSTYSKIRNLCWCWWRIRLLFGGRCRSKTPWAWGLCCFGFCLGRSKAFRGCRPISIWTCRWLFLFLSVWLKGRSSSSCSSFIRMALQFAPLSPLGLSFALRSCSFTLEEEVQRFRNTWWSPSQTRRQSWWTCRRSIAVHRPWRHSPRQ